MKRVGVFVCDCGTNIASVVDTERVAREALEMPGVVYATNYKYMCSDPGQIDQESHPGTNLERGGSFMFPPYARKHFP